MPIGRKKKRGRYMKLYKGKVWTIAQEVIQALTEKELIEVLPEMKNEAEIDLKAIMTDYLRRERRLRAEIKDYMASNKISYDRMGEILRMKSKEANHPLGDKVMPYLANQFLQMFLNSPSIDEVYGDDRDIKAEIFAVLKHHNVDERELREEAKSKLKHLHEDSMEFQILFPKALQEVRQKRGLL